MPLDAQRAAKMKANVTRLTQEKISRLLPNRPADSHKGMFGTVAVIGGANGMVGAALLAARAALKLGTGCIHVCFLGDRAPSVDLLQPELMIHSASDVLSLEGVDVFAVGCGLGRSLAAQKLLHELLTRDASLVLDADGLNLLAGSEELQGDLRGRLSQTVLTPHPGEAARLLACTTTDIQRDRVGAIRALADKFNCNVVLKGAGSLCAKSDKSLFMNTTGNPGMSSPGMGDVLTGIISALMAQGLAGDDAMLLGVYVHGAAGDALYDQKAGIGMTATEVTDWARWLLNQWR